MVSDLSLVAEKHNCEKQVFIIKGVPQNQSVFDSINYNSSI